MDMIFRLSTQLAAGLTYVAGYRLVSEHGTPAADDEIACPLMEILPDGAQVASLRDENGKLRFALEDNPDHGKASADGSVDTRRKVIVERRQVLTPEEMEARAQRDRRAKVAAALPDLLLATADGKDIGAEVRRVIGEG